MAVTCFLTAGLAITSYFSEFLIINNNLNNNNDLNLTKGRVEVYVNGQWGTVCSDQWDLADGVVACQQLGFVTAYDALRMHSFGSNNNIPILVNNLECRGDENLIQDCPGIFGNTSQNIVNCDHSQVAGLQCIDASKL